MELVPATKSGSHTDTKSVPIILAARRVTNIQTVPVRVITMSRTIRAIGELTYSEGALKTISAYMDGRLDRLYADYTRVQVQIGGHLVPATVFWTGGIVAGQERPRRPPQRHVESSHTVEPRPLRQRQTEVDRNGDDGFTDRAARIGQAGE